MLIIISTTNLQRIDSIVFPHLSVGFGGRRPAAWSKLRTSGPPGCHRLPSLGSFAWRVTGHRNGLPVVSEEALGCQEPVLSWCEQRRLEMKWWLVISILLMFNHIYWIFKPTKKTVHEEYDANGQTSENNEHHLFKKGAHIYDTSRTWCLEVSYYGCMAIYACSCSILHLDIPNIPWHTIIRFLWSQLVQHFGSM